jgi:uncharacterized linocin/CFP29 family protein
MVDVTALHIHCTTPETARGRKRIVKKIKPSDPENKLAIQQDIGEAVRKLRDTGLYEYYYVVIEIDRGGKPAYRTVIPKTMF